MVVFDRQLSPPIPRVSFRWEMGTSSRGLFWLCPAGRGHSAPSPVKFGPWAGSFGHRNRLPGNFGQPAGAAEGAAERAARGAWPRSPYLPDLQRAAGAFRRLSQGA
jgi:hypothetical protein